MKVLLWIGNEPNQKALANKIHTVFPLAGIVTETRARKNSSISLKLLFEKVYEKIFLSEIGKAWREMKSHYDNIYPAYPNVPTINVQNINSEESFEFSEKIGADLIIVSGTGLVNKKMLGINPTIGILNLHTGLSPYIKGGPNCTNWCISTKQFHLIGNTIMWIDAGIDTGNLIATEFTNLQGIETLNDVHLKVMEHAHSLYVRAIQSVAKGNRTSVPQSNIAEGKTYYNKDWNVVHKRNLVENFRLLKPAIASGEINVEKKEIKTISL